MKKHISSLIDCVCLKKQRQPTGTESLQTATKQEIPLSENHNKMVNKQQIQADIVDRLKTLNPDKVILFGSYANGTATEDSDIDLYVVTNDDFMPVSWKEKNSIYLKMSKKIRDLKIQVPIDLIVHTRKMHEKFIQLNSSFAREINQEGIRLI